MTDRAGVDNRDVPGVGDLVAGVVAIVFGAAVLLHIRGFPELPGGAPGPALFPGVLAGLFVMVGSILVVRWVSHHGLAARARPAPRRSAGPMSTDEDASEESSLQSATPATTAWLNALSVVGAVVFYLLLSELLGFLVTMTLLVLGLSWRLGARPLPALTTAVVTSALLYLVFDRLLVVPLPAGPFS